VQTAARAIGQQLLIVDINTERDIEPAFATFAQGGADALLVGSSPFMIAHRERLAALAARHGLPAIYNLRDHVVAGGLMSYGASNAEAYRQAGAYAGRILKGEKPGDLPVIRSTRFEFVLNLKTAKALGLDIPPMLLALTDEVIE
jgi:putative ABC transport system substrate-binding protein